MSLLHRLRDVVEEKANAQLARAENPEEALDLSYQKLLDNLQQARRAVADALTAEKSLEVQAGQLRQNQTRLEDEARRAVEAGRDDLGREALTRAQALREQAAVIERQIPDLKQREQHLEEVTRTLQGKVAMFQAQKETIKAQYSSAQAATRIGESVSGLSEEMADVALIVQRAQDKTAQMQARSAAIDQLMESGSLEAIGAPGGADDIARQLDAQSGRAAIDGQLAALKAQLAPGASPARLPAAAVVVRIQGEGQYLLPATQRPRLDEFDREMLRAVEARDEPAFRSTLSAALELVRAASQRLDAGEVRPSEIVLPSPAMTLQEACDLLEPATSDAADPRAREA